MKKTATTNKNETERWKEKPQKVTWWWMLQNDLHTGYKPASPFSVGLSEDQPGCMLLKFCWCGGSTTICGAWDDAYPCSSCKIQNNGIKAIHFYIDRDKLLINKSLFGVVIGAPCKATFSNPIISHIICGTGNIHP